MTIKALIPVRSGSQRVKNKNIRPFAGSSLLEIKIKQMLRIPELDGVVVNSNDDEMLRLAKSLGAETVKRDEYFASSTVSINEVYYNLAQHFDADDMVFADVTNPLIKDKTIRDCVNLFYNNKEVDSVNTVNSVKMFLWQNGRPLNYSEDNKPRSQDLPEILAINSAINVLSRDTMLTYKRFVGEVPFLYTVDPVEGLDIDNQIDFDFAEFIYRRQLEEEK